MRHAILLLSSLYILVPPARGESLGQEILRLAEDCGEALGGDRAAATREARKLLRTFNSSNAPATEVVDWFATYLKHHAGRFGEFSVTFVIGDDGVLRVPSLDDERAAPLVANAQAWTPTGLLRILDQLAAREVDLEVQIRDADDNVISYDPDAGDWTDGRPVTGVYELITTPRE